MSKNFKNKYIAICNYSYNGGNYSSRVKDKYGKQSFDTLDEVSAVVKADIEEYAESEQNAGRNVKIVDNHIEWLDNRCVGEYDAKWFIHSI